MIIPAATLDRLSVYNILTSRYHNLRLLLLNLISHKGYTNYLPVYGVNTYLAGSRKAMIPGSDQIYCRYSPASKLHKILLLLLTSRILHR